MRTDPEAILAELAALRAGATMCPGELARRLGTTQGELRPRLQALAEAGRIVVTQRGVAADLRELRGPYRVAPVATDAKKAPARAGGRGG